MGFSVSLHSSNRESVMSALGQKQTFGNVRAMSALLPKADIRQMISMSALCQKRTIQLGASYHFFN